MCSVYSGIILTFNDMENMVKLLNGINLESLYSVVFSSCIIILANLAIY